MVCLRKLMSTYLWNITSLWTEKPPEPAVCICGWYRAVQLDVIITYHLDKFAPVTEITVPQLCTGSRKLDRLLGTVERCDGMSIRYLVRLKQARNIRFQLVSTAMWSTGRLQTLKLLQAELLNQHTCLRMRLRYNSWVSECWWRHKNYVVVSFQAVKQCCTDRLSAWPLKSCARQRLLRPSPPLLTSRC